MTFAVALAVTLIGVVGINAAVDPFGMVHSWRSPTKGDLRLCSYELRRTVKAMQIENSEWDGLVIGSSREELSLDPSLDLFPAKRVYNAALPSVSAKEYSSILRYAAARRDLKYILVDLDPITFGRLKNDKAGDWHKSPLAGRSVKNVLAEYLFNPFTFGDALRWAVMPTKDSDRVCRPNGSRLLQEETDITEVKRRFEIVTEKLFSAHDGRLSSFANIEQALGQFQTTLAAIAKPGMTIDLMIPPNHAIFNEYIHTIGWHENFVRFRRVALQMTEALRLKTGADISLWDFSGYTAMNTETVAGIERAKLMLSFIDVLHVKPQAINAVVCKMRNYQPNGCSGIPKLDSGVRLTAETLATVERDEGALRARYLEQHPAISAFVSAMAKPGMAARDQRIQAQADKKRRSEKRVAPRAVAPAR
jgi:hypothetical protein